jgi:hypothetical protein
MSKTLRIPQNRKDARCAGRVSRAFVSAAQRFVLPPRCLIARLVQINCLKRPEGLVVPLGGSTCVVTRIYRFWRDECSKRVTGDRIFTVPGPSEGSMVAEKVLGQADGWEGRRSASVRQAVAVQEGPVFRCVEATNGLRKDFVRSTACRTSTLLYCCYEVRKAGEETAGFDVPMQQSGDHRRAGMQY